MEITSSTQQRIFTVLSDGKPHTKQELFSCLDDNLADVNTVCVHISNLRKILRPAGRDILCEYQYRRYYYRMVILLPSACK